MSYTIHFPADFLTNIDIWAFKGFANLEVTHDGARYRLSFVDLGNVRMGLESSDPDLVACIAEPGMVIVQKITEGHISSAVEQLVGTRFFDTLVPAPSSGRGHRILAKIDISNTYFSREIIRRLD